MEKVAPTDSTVLIAGEIGTGKEVIARAIHNLSRRKGRALITVNCAALPPSLIESELFGREKGAYTGAMTMMKGRFELADGSTLFLDEIGELSLEVQAKLLRVLEEDRFERLGSAKTMHVDVRIIAASNRDLAQDAQADTFRKDLYYRLNVFPIVIPPLRERPEELRSTRPRNCVRGAGNLPSARGCRAQVYSERAGEDAVAPHRSGRRRRAPGPQTNHVAVANEEARNQAAHILTPRLAPTFLTQRRQARQEAAIRQPGDSATGQFGNLV